MPSDVKEFDVIIIGGGPAGMSAALWCIDLGLTSILIEKESEFGGQLLWTYNKIKNYLGCKAKNGHDLAQRFIQHIENTKLNRITGCEVVAANLANKTVTLADDRSFSGNAIVIATGVRRRKLGVPGEDKFVGHGILESGIKSKNQVVGKTVAIVGGGDAALENALILSKTAKKVIVIHRGRGFSARNEFIESCRVKSTIDFILDHIITAIEGDEELENIVVSNVKTGQLVKIVADALLVRIGVCPNTEIFREQFEIDEKSYIIVNKYGETSIPGVFAVGDISSPFSPTISSSVGDAVQAIKTISWRQNFKEV